MSTTKKNSTNRPTAHSKAVVRHSGTAVAKSRSLTIDSLMKTLGIEPSDRSITAPPTAADIAYVYDTLVSQAQAQGVTKASKTPVFKTNSEIGISNPTPEHVLEFGRLIFHEGDGGVMGCDYQLMKVGWALMQLAIMGGATGRDVHSIYANGRITKTNAQAMWEMAQFLKTAAVSAVSTKGAQDDDVPTNTDDLESLDVGDLGSTDMADDGNLGDSGDEPDGQDAELAETLAGISR